MNKKDKEKWVAALRSGMYKQGKEALYNKKGNSFCCLGVARDLGLGRKRPKYQVLTKEFLTPKEQAILATMNDLGNTFEQIADWIEENL